MKKEILDCACSSSEHIVVVNYSDNDEYIYLHYHLQYISWYKRIGVGIKYIFGFKSKYGCFGELVLDSNNINVIENILNHLKQNNGK